MPEKAAIVDLDQAIWTDYVRLRNQGEVAALHGISQPAVSQAIGRYLATIPAEEKAQHRVRTLARLEELYQAHREAALAPGSPPWFGPWSWTRPGSWASNPDKSRSSTAGPWPMPGSLARPWPSCWSSGGPMARSGPGPSWSAWTRGRVVDMPWVLTPPLAYMLEALHITREMEAQGIVLTQDQAQALAHASLGPEREWVDQEPALTPEGRQMLDRIVAERDQGQVQTQVHGCTGCYIGARHGPCTRTAPEALPQIAPERAPAQKPRGLDQGQVDHGAHRGDGTADRDRKIDPITRYLREVPDEPDERWSPT
jgi:hypothetical protein